ncbi:MAG: PaaI family thioesterase [Acidobacteriota bacterium]|nr:PaaI family thioesterase [Acidobacteriota bacterium]
MSPAPPLPCPEADWEPVDPFPEGPATRSFVSGRAAALERTRVVYYRRASSDHLYACVWFGPAAEGPPEAVHGGATAAVLDEAMGAACWMNRHPVVAARITINYRHMMPLGFSGRAEAWIDRVERRKVFLTSRLTDEAGKVYAEGEGLFITLTPEQMRASARAREARRAALP